MSLIQTAFKQLIKTVFLQSLRKHLKIEQFSSEARWSNESCLFSGRICPSRGAFAAFERRTFHLDSIRFSRFQDCMEYFFRLPSFQAYRGKHSCCLTAVSAFNLTDLPSALTCSLPARCMLGRGTAALHEPKSSTNGWRENFAITKRATRDS